MYHTFEAKIQMTANEFNVLKEKLYEHSVGKAKFYKNTSNNEQHQVWHCELLRGNGIHIKLACFANNGFARFFLILRVNPKRVINNGDFLSVAHESDVRSLYAAMNNYLNGVGINFPFEYFTIERIDYCYNCAFTDEFMSSCFMELLERSALLYQFESPSFYCNTKHRSISPKGAIYAQNGSVVINIYDKYPQMLKCYENQAEGMDDCRGVIRFEAQCHRAKVRSMRYSNELPDMMAFRWLTEAFSEKTLLYYLRKIFCNGDYWTLSQARQIIHNSNFRDNTKQIMLYILDLANTKRSLMKALDFLHQEGHQPDYLNRILKKFDIINVNPVTVPLNWGYCHFESPLKIVARAVEDIKLQLDNVPHYVM